ncbi:MAG: GFA family protein [Pseudomonadota bacterium]
MHTDTWVIPAETFSARIRGNCLCGAVRWSYDAPFTTMLHCHCSVCRKQHGTLFATFLAGPLTTCRWRGGTEKIVTWQSSAQGRRSFCSVCGSKVPGVDHASQQVFMPAGAVGGDLGMRPQMHLFVGSKSALHQLHDGLPKHDAFPPEWGSQGIDTPPRSGREGVTSGSCACGQMRFELDGRPFRMHHCHCSRCQHARGGAHSTNVLYKIEALRYTEGEPLLTDFAMPGAQYFGTSFCSACGGALPRRTVAGGVAVVPVGALDTDPQIHPMAHQWVSSKVSWFDIHDGIPQFAEAPPRPPAPG